MTRVVVLGATGMLGHMVTKVLSADKAFSVVGTQTHAATAPQYFNVFDGIETLEQVSTDASWFINCIGALAHDIRTDDTLSVARAERLNGTFPQELAAFAYDRGARIIHMSTDGVFSPDHNDARENEAPDAADVYGRTKASGEVSAAHVLNIRTSIIGPSPMQKAGIWEWFLRQPDGGTINGYTNHVWHGVTTRQFATLCATIMTHDAFDIVRGATPAIHFVPNGALTKFELLELFRSMSGKNIVINPTASPVPLRRTLTTTNTAWQSFFPHGLSMRDVLSRAW